MLNVVPSLFVPSLTQYGQNSKICTKFDSVRVKSKDYHPHHPPKIKATKHSTEAEWKIHEYYISIMIPKIGDDVPTHSNICYIP